MGVPKKRKSHSRSRMRRSHDALSAVHLGRCLQNDMCSGRQPHTVCMSCGLYASGTRRVRQIVNVVAIEEE